MAIVTVIIPVYNGEKWICRCLDSIAAQTYQDFHLLLIDDGSSDRSAEVISRWSGLHPEISLKLEIQENAGVSETRNRGITEADTPFLAFLDQDDYIGPRYLSDYVRAIEESEADIVCGGYQRITSEGRVLRRVSLTPHPWAPFVVVAPWAHLYRTDFIRRHGIQYLKTGIGEDVYFSLMAYSRTDRIRVIDSVDYFWVDNPVSVSNSRQNSMNRKADPFVLLNALDQGLPRHSLIPEEWIEYYLYRYIVWYILYTVRGTPEKEALSQTDRLIGWLSERFPSFFRNRNISLFGPPGEPFSIRLSVVGFNALYRLGLLKPMIRLFSRKQKP